LNIHEHKQPEEELLLRLSEGNLDGFRALMEWYFPLLAAFAEKFVSDRALAQDIAQDTFIKVWQRHASFGNMLALRKFMYVTTRNGCLNALRERQRAGKRDERFVQQDVENERFATDEILYTEMLAQVRKTMEHLPEKMRQVFTLAYVDGLNNQEIAERLQLSQQTVRNQKTRALQIIKGHLGEKR